MKHHHHYMKYLFVLLLFLPTCLMAQNKEEKMPGHITKIQKLEDVNVTGNRPHFIRLKGYYRSYQTNDSVMKYFINMWKTWKRLLWKNRQWKSCW